MHTRLEYLAMSAWKDSRLPTPPAAPGEPGLGPSSAFGKREAESSAEAGRASGGDDRTCERDGLSGRSTHVMAPVNACENVNASISSISWLSRVPPVDTDRPY